MRKKHQLVREEDDSPPQALILDGNKGAQVLKDKLDKSGVQTTLIRSTENLHGKYRYIFSFDKRKQALFLVENLLLPDGKFVYLDTIYGSLQEKEFRDFCKLLGKLSGGKKFVAVYRLGRENLTKKEELAEEIIKTVFEPVSFHHKEVLVFDKRQPLRTVEDKLPVKKRTAHFKRIKKPAVFQEISRNKSCKISQAGRDFQSSTSSEKRVLEEKIKFKKFNFRRAVVISLLFLPLFAAVLFSSWYVYSVKNIFISLKRGFASSDLTKISSGVKRAKSQATLARKIYDVSTTVAFPLRSLDFIQDIGGLIYSAEDVLSLTDDLLLSSKTFFNPSSSAFGAYRSLDRDDLISLVDKLEILVGSLENAQSKLESTTIPFFPKEEYISFLENWHGKLKDAEEMSMLLDLVLFGKENRVYLILFQNNMELRPTGGFIGSFGLLEVGEGQLKKFAIYDVYSADGQLKGHVDPPEAIRKYLSQPHFFLRDSNFDPDFAASSQTAAFFLEKEIGTVVDGVIGVNLYLVKDLLKILGPVVLADFGQEKISAQNFLFKMQLFSQRDFFPGSSEKKDFLNSLMNALLVQAVAGEKLPWFDLLAVVKDSLDQKNLLIYLKDESAQAVVEDHGWGGRLVDVRCVNLLKQKKAEGQKLSDSCLSDYLMIVEANLGVNKANYFVEKKINVAKHFEKNGDIQTEVVIDYSNKAQAEVFSQETYVNYVRLFIPQGVKVQKVDINGKRLDGNLLDFTLYPPDKSSIGFLVTVPPGENRRILVSYNWPGVFLKSDSYYQLLVQKQGGDKPTPLVLNVSYPSENSLKSLNFDPHNQTETTTTFSVDMSVDRLFAFESVFENSFVSEILSFRAKQGTMTKVYPQ